MKKLQSSDLIGKTLDELEALRQGIEVAIEGATDNAALAEGMMGQKLIKRLADDLDAVRKKYASIKGSPEDQLAALHRLQGREAQLFEELENLSSAARVKRELGANLETIVMWMGEKKKDTGTR
jgi:uncharacterized protein YicC (UPF0701 family)